MKRIEITDLERKKLAEAVPIVRKDGWRPIETAPKDGTGLLVYSDERIISAMWSVGADDWVEVVHGYTFYDPTHWMPLPEPPK